MASREIVFALANPGRGGMQSQVSLVAAELARRGHHVTIAVGGGSVPAPVGVTVVTLPAFTPSSTPAFALALRRVGRGAIVHAHGLRLAPILPFTGARSTVVTCHGIDPTRAAPAIRVARLSRVPIISCGAGPQRLLQRFGVRSDVINNAIGPAGATHTAEECRESFGLVDGVPIIIYPARFSDQKNHLGLVAALATVRDALGDDAPDVVCLGDGPLFERVRAAAERPGRPLVRCAPYRDDAASWIGASSFFVLPSLWEGQPLVVLEAVAQGRSVLTTTPDIDDVVIEGGTGRSVPPESLASHLIKWCGDHTLRPFDASVATELLAAHQLSVVVDRYEDLYQSL